ncbi:MAG TPA: hypothetical protein VJ840_00855 [Gemmatimonadaceae bacterium]|nr:hypothetical protein [Gemmatimonadaceae bacterium]
MPKRRQVGEVFKRGRYYAIRYYDARGRRRIESSGSAKQEDTEKRLRQRLKALDDHVSLDMQIGKVKFEDGAKDLINDYSTNGNRGRPREKRPFLRNFPVSRLFDRSCDQSVD